MSLPLNLIIDRTADGKFRAALAGHPELAVEAADFPGLLDAVRDTFLPLVAGDPGASERSTPEEAVADGNASDQDAETAPGDEDDQGLRRLAMQRMPDRETLRKLVARYPVPDHWPEGDEDWDDAP
jgi:hypothetical protein